jgi:hypothetical protein
MIGAMGEIYDEEGNRAYREFTRLITKTFKLNLAGELEKFKLAAKEQLITRDKPGLAELLEKAGLVEYLDDVGSMFSSQYLYGLTEKGKKLYHRIYGGSWNGTNI